MRELLGNLNRGDYLCPLITSNRPQTTSIFVVLIGKNQAGKGLVVAFREKLNLSAVNTARCVNAVSGISTSGKSTVIGEHLG